jgi:hypothetical protein
VLVVPLIAPLIALAIMPLTVWALVITASGQSEVGSEREQGR